MTKDLLRLEWLEKRRSIPHARRQEAAGALFEVLMPYIGDEALVLSYASFKDELDTSLLNSKLAKSGRLVLPRTFGRDLHLYEVRNPEIDLRKGSFSLMEPDPNLCKAISPSRVRYALVPAIAFDAANHRLGYGKGFYDRFLHQHGIHLSTIGIGFLEQLSPQLFPVGKFDIALSRIVLV